MHTADLETVIFHDHTIKEGAKKEPSEPILAIRSDTVAASDLVNAVYLEGAEAVASDSGRLLPAIVIERAAPNSAVDVIEHRYTPHVRIAAMLEQSSSSVLREDAAVVRFATEMFELAGGARDARPSRRREDHSLRLHAENVVLRNAIGLSPTGPPVTPSTAAVAVARLRGPALPTSPAAPPLSPLVTSSEAPTTQGRPLSPASRPGPPKAIAPGVLATGLEADGKTGALHSPLQWDTETEAAINARTKYQAYGRRVPSPTRLDKVAQGHLVARLHDKSVDQRRRREEEGAAHAQRAVGDRRVLSPEEVHDLGARLHDQQREHMVKTRQKLQEVYLPAIPRRALTPEVQKASAVRMHDETMARAKKNMDALVDRYVHSTMPPAKKLNVEAQRDMANRLSSTK